LTILVRKIGAGFIGTGNIALLHTLGYKECPDAEIVALCDLNQKRAIAFREEAGLPASVKVYKDVRELCRDDRVDMVEILTPHASHELLAVQAAEAGKHVSVQKPPAMTLSSYDRMVDAARKAGVRFRVFENFRYHPPYVRAFELIRDGVIGQVKAVNMRMWVSIGTSGDYRGQKYRIPFHTLLWKNTDYHNYKANALFDDGYHKHSMIQGLIPQPVTDVIVWCGWQRVLKGMPKIDSPAVVVYQTRKSDCYGTLNVNEVPSLPLHSNYFTCDEFLEITGSTGIIMVTGCSGDLFAGCEAGGPGKPGVYWFSKEDGDIPPFPGAGSWKSDCGMPTDWSHSFIDCTRHFASCLARDEWFDENDPRPLWAERGRKILQLTLATVRSLRTGGTKVRVASIVDGPGVEAEPEKEQHGEPEEAEMATDDDAEEKETE